MKFLIIVGVGRSGTSLLQSMMSAHADIAMLPETSFIRRYLIKNRFFGKKNSFKMQLCSDPYLRRWNTDILTDALESERATIIKPMDLYKKVLLQYQESYSSSENLYLAEKDPKLIESMHIVNKMFVSANFLHIYRDPRDVYLSKKKATWSKDQSIFIKLLANVVQVKLAKRFLSKNSDRIYEIQYESLLLNPELELKGICHYLDLNFHSKMLNYQKEAEKLVASDELNWKKETLGPLLTDNKDKWKRELSSFEIRAVEDICTDSMKKGKYIYENQKINIRERFYILALKAAVNISALLYMYILLFIKVPVRT